jgi:hypothetical protein
MVNGALFLHNLTVGYYNQAGGFVKHNFRSFQKYVATAVRKLLILRGRPPRKLAFQNL